MFALRLLAVATVSSPLNSICQNNRRTSALLTPCRIQVPQAVVASKPINICATSGLGLDVFGIADDQSIFHKYYRGSQWEPVPGFENMKGEVPDHAPTAVSWAPGNLDYFVVGSDNTAHHKFWDGSGNWEPADQDYRDLKGNFTSGLAAASWGEGRIDLVGKGPDDAYYHLYMNGRSDVSDWENFGENELVTHLEVIADLTDRSARR